MNPPPNRRPTTAGDTPPISIDGINSDQHEAATMTPPANPITASIRRRGALRNRNTGSVPMAVSA
jgi:hypothetical protein